MANLNIPFMLWQKDNCSFDTDPSTLCIYSNLERPQANDKKTTLEALPRHLMVTSDKKSGSMQLSSLEIYESEEIVGGTTSENVSDQVELKRFLIKVQPKILCVPDVARKDTLKLIAITTLRCPAPQILDSSPFYLVSLHSDNILRLWNTDDGRCVNQSYPDLFVTKALSIMSFEDYPGYIAVVGDEGDIYLVEAYTMTMVNHSCLQFKGFHSISQIGAALQIVDSQGLIIHTVDKNHAQNQQKSAQCSKKDQASMLKFTRESYQGDNGIKFKFEEVGKVGFLTELQQRQMAVRRSKLHKEVLLHHRNLTCHLIISQDQIEQIKQGQQTTRLSLFEFTDSDHLVFACVLREKFIITINCKNQLSVYTMDDLTKDFKPTQEQLYVTRIKLLEPQLKLDLVCDSKIHDHSYALLGNKKFNELLSDHRTQEAEMQAAIEKLLPKMCKFTYHPSLDLLITHCGQMMLSWNLRHLGQQTTKLPLNITPMKTFNSNGPISYNPICMTRTQKQNQYSFFYPEETTTNSVTFNQYYIMGTSEGRVFKIPMFQDKLSKVEPFRLLATHVMAGPVIHLYIDGNTLISVAGTSVMANKLVETYKELASPSNINRIRTDSIIKQRKSGRSSSVHSVPSTENYFCYTKQKPVLKLSTFSPIKHVFQVKTLQMTWKYLLDEPCYEESEYICVMADSEAILISRDLNRPEIRLSSLPLKNIYAVFHDKDSQSLILVDESLHFFTFNIRSRQIGLRKRSPSDLGQLLKVGEMIDKLQLVHQNYFNHMARKDLNIIDFGNFGRNFQQNRVLKGQGTHSTIEFLSLAQQLPLLYSPQNTVSKNYSYPLQKLLKMKQQLLSFKMSTDVLATQQAVVKVVVEILVWDEDVRFQSSLDNQVGVTSQKMQVCNSSQTVMIIDVQEMAKTLKTQIQEEVNDRPQPENAFAEDQQQQLLMDDCPIQNAFPSVWPAKMLGLVQPFNFNETLDYYMEKYFSLTLPFLNFKIGLQGSDKSFSFVISEADREYRSEKNNYRLSSVIALMSASKQIKAKGIQALITDVKQADAEDANRVLSNTFNSDYWKVSTYLSSIIPVALFHCLAVIVKIDTKDVSLLMQEWLYFYQDVQMASSIVRNPLSPFDSPQRFSCAVFSQLILNEDPDIVASSGQVIFKPLLLKICETDFVSDVLSQVKDWSCLLMQTYEQLVSYRNQLKKLAMSQTQPQKQDSRSSTKTQAPQEDSKSSVMAFFGELELRSLVNLCYLTHMLKTNAKANELSSVMDRVVKLVIILIGEIIAVKESKDNKLTVGLLTVLMQCLHMTIKPSSGVAKTLEQRDLFNDMVGNNLKIFNFYSPRLKDGEFIAQIETENFHLIMHTNSQLFLKHTAAKVLLEVGCNHTEEFMQQIKIHATNLNEGLEYQRNVLETLRYFVNGYPVLLEKYLIEIVQILLRCLDPNDLALRKNSHKQVCSILQNMVRLFPMVVFHSESQRLAVGTHNGPIGIYDVRTSAKLEIFEGHTKAVTCLTFDAPGKWLVSYSEQDLTVRLWKIGNASFFQTIMGGNGKETRKVQLQKLVEKFQVDLNESQPKIKRKDSLIPMTPIGGKTLTFQPDTPAVAKSIDFEEEKDSSLSLGRQDSADMMRSSGDDSESSNGRTNKCRIVFLKDQPKAVELTREDGSKQIINNLI